MLYNNNNLYYDNNNNNKQREIESADFANNLTRQ